MSIIQNPAARQPNAAPSVFQQYNAPTRLPINWSELVTSRASNGKVAPISKHGTSRIAKDKVNRTSVLTNNESENSADKSGARTRSRASKRGTASAHAAITA